MFTLVLRHQAMYSLAKHKPVLRLLEARIRVAPSLPLADTTQIFSLLLSQIPPECWVPAIDQPAIASEHQMMFPKRLPRYR